MKYQAQHNYTAKQKERGLVKTSVWIPQGTEKSVSRLAYRLRNKFFYRQMKERGDPSLKLLD